MPRVAEDAGNGLAEKAGVPLRIAQATYCNPDAYQRYRELVEKQSLRPASPRTIVVPPQPEVARARQAERLAALKVLETEALTKLRGGELVATGFAVTRTGRDPNEPRRRIPYDVLTAT